MKQVVCVLLFTLIVLGASLMQPRISVTDSDARAYIEGAYSIQAEAGYQDLAGNALNHWPPGYSLLLSLFPQPLTAAFVINYLSLGFAVVFIYLLTQRAGWHPWASMGLALALGFGFLRSIAINAKPDILTYALFLIGMQCVAGIRNGLRTLGACIWSVLIPLKLIAVIFTPALLLTDWFLLRKRSPYSFRFLHYGVIAGVWLAALAAVIGFNYCTIKVVMPATHEASNLTSFIQEIIRFCSSFPRVFLANWYGSIRQIKVLLPFSLTLISAVACLITLRPYGVEGRKYAYLGVAMFSLSWMLEMMKHFYTDVRLMGYGLLIFLLAFRPARGTEKRWLVYACFTVLLATANVLTTNSLGVNDPRYARVAADVLTVYPLREPVFSNSYHILDVHVRLPSVPVDSLKAVPPGAAFLKIHLPSYDAIQPTVWHLEDPPAEWIVIAKLKDASLYRKPTAKQSSAESSGQGDAPRGASHPEHAVSRLP